MQRALLAIGCDAYDDATVDDLDGAERDAQRVFEELTKPDVGDYSLERSRLLLSPKLTEVREALEDIIYRDGPLDVFTLYFAGHGTVAGGGFYMAVRDTRIDRLPTTAYWLSEALKGLSGRAPNATNIIVDACASGGLASDVDVLLKSDLQGNANSPAVVLLAMASRDQSAHETDEGGAGTNALLECIDGRVFIQEGTGALSLLEIAPAITERFAKDPDQQPRFWAINVNQRSAFCRNPHFQASIAAAFKHWSPRSFIESVQPLIASHAGQPADQVADVDRLIGGLILRSQESPDQFLEAEVRATGVSALLPFCAASSFIAKRVEDECQAVAKVVGRALSRAVVELQKDKFALLSPRNGAADLFILPHRIWKIIGWAGAAFFILKDAGREAEFPANDLLSFMRAVIEHYPLTSVLLSERQGSSIAIGLSAAAELGFLAEGETLLGILFNSILEHGGRIARGTIANDQLHDFMHLRHVGDLKNAQRLTANPTEAVAVVLRLAPMFDLAEVFDEAMAELDHLHLNVFTADDYAQFAEEYVEDGTNHSFDIGRGVWTIDDLLTAWPKEAALGPDLPSTRAASYLSALLFPDRIPWFIVPVPILSKAEVD